MSSAAWLKRTGCVRAGRAWGYAARAGTRPDGVNCSRWSRTDANARWEWARSLVPHGNKGSATTTLPGPRRPQRGPKLIESSMQAHYCGRYDRPTLLEPTASPPPAARRRRGARLPKDRICSAGQTPSPRMIGSDFGATMEHACAREYTSCCSGGLLQRLCTPVQARNPVRAAGFRRTVMQVHASMPHGAVDRPFASVCHGVAKRTNACALRLRLAAHEGASHEGAPARCARRTAQWVCQAACHARAALQPCGGSLR